MSKVAERGLPSRHVCAARAPRSFTHAVQLSDHDACMPPGTVLNVHSRCGLPRPCSIIPHLLTYLWVYHTLTTQSPHEPGCCPHARVVPKVHDQDEGNPTTMTGRRQPDDDDEEDDDDAPHPLPPNRKLSLKKTEATTTNKPTTANGAPATLFLNVCVNRISFSIAGTGPLQFRWHEVCTGMHDPRPGATVPPLGGWDGGGEPSRAVGLGPVRGVGARSRHRDRTTSMNSPKQTNQDGGGGQGAGRKGVRVGVGDPRSRPWVGVGEGRGKNVGPGGCEGRRAGRNRSSWVREDRGLWALDNIQISTSWT